MPFPVDKRFIEAAEQELGVRFPEAYIRFMSASNGGNTPDDRWLLHPVYDNSDRKRMQRTSNHIVRETAKARAHNGFPHGAVVVGEDMEGRLLLLLPDSGEPGRLSDAVYSWHPFHRDLDKVADDFDDF
jgi:hypothetical protein